MLFDAVTIALREWLERELREELVRQGHVATKELHDSIKVHAQKAVGSLVFTAEMLEYGEAVNKGRKPGAKGVPISALLDWMRVRKITISGVSERSAAFIIQNSIRKKGIPSTGGDDRKNFVGKVERKGAQTLPKIVEELTGRALAQQLELIRVKYEADFAA